MLRYRTTVTPGEGMDFVISDGTKDRHGTRINPKGWQFGDYVPVLFGHGGVPVGVWENLRVEKDKLLGRLKLGREGSSPRIDEIRSLVEQGILRAVSAGFEVHDYGKPGKSEFDYERQTLMEASLVAVPSNPNAIAQARALSDKLSRGFGEQADEPVKATNGGHAGTHPEIRTSPKMETLATRIEAAQNDLNAARDALTTYLADETAADTTQTEALAGEIEKRESVLSSLKKAEKALALRTVSLDAGEAEKKPALPAIRKPLGTKLREVAKEDLIYRAAHVALRAYVTGKDPIAVLEDRYGDHEETQIFVRAAVAGATTTTAGWAQELVETAQGDFISSLRAMSVFPGLAAAGTALNFGPSRGALKIPSRASTPSITGSFVAEGSPIPVRKLGLTSITLNPNKMGVISVFTREIARYSNPQIEGLLRDEIRADTALTIDAALIDTNGPASTTRPAGLRYNISGLTAATGGGYKAIVNDINTLAAPFDTANAGRSLHLLMNPREARNLAMSPGPDGTFGWTTAFMGEFTVHVSTTITAGLLIMIDAADFVAVNGAPEFEVSEHTVLHMEDTTPLQIGTVGSPNTVAAPAQSMFQTASLALRMLMDITWSMRRTGMVQWMTGVNWAPAP